MLHCHLGPWQALNPPSRLAASVAGHFGGWPLRWLATSVAGRFGGWPAASVAGRLLQWLAGRFGGWPLRDALFCLFLQLSVLGISP